MTSTPSGSSLGTFQRSATQEDIFTPLGQLSLGPGFPNSGASNSPRRLRSMFSWDQTDGPVSTPLGGANGGMTPVTSTSPIATQVTSAGTESRHTTPGSASSATAGGGSGGANAPIGSQRYDQERMRPQRQTSFGYGQQRSGQQSREGDELRGSGRNGVEIIVE
ncbi:hypothetical protein KEM55_005359 [Ascosphaera atra]|nr:hypothetical protein KEM55_005359 [Ascosphaera atra]